MVRNCRAATAFLCAVLAVASCGSPPSSSTLTPIAHRVTGQGGGLPPIADPPLADSPVKPASVVVESPTAGPSLSSIASPSASEPPTASASGLGPPPAKDDHDSAPSRRNTRRTVEPTPPHAPPPAGTIRERNDSAAVTLTFDDGPSPYTPQILALLRASGVKATFCVVGVNVRAHPDYLRAIVADGHTLCNHTWSHDLKLGTRSSDAIRADLQRTNDAIHQVVPGVAIRYFRHPGGNFTPRAIATAAELGMESDGWDVDPWDWNTKAYPAGPTMINHVVKVVERETRPGSIILSHDGGGDRSSTIAAYRTLIPWLKERFDLRPLP